MSDWTQPLCLTCFVAWTLGRGEPPCEPMRVIGVEDPCLICGTPTAILVRIDPQLTVGFKHRQGGSAHVADQAENQQHDQDEDNDTDE